MKTWRRRSRGQKRVRIGLLGISQRHQHLWKKINLEAQKHRHLILLLLSSRMR
jgi:hypothetical protein